MLAIARPLDRKERATDQDLVAGTLSRVQSRSCEKAKSDDLSRNRPVRLRDKRNGQ